MSGRGGILAGFVAAALCLLGPGSAQAAFPGENGKIAFSRGGSIYAMNSDGTGVQQLTATGGDSEPAWSADGRRIAFTSTRDGNPEIYVMDQDGGGQTNLTNDPADDSHPSWSPDGARIAFERLTPGISYDTHVMNADGTGDVDITDGPGESGADPVWSPDGSRIAVIDINNITLINPDGTGRAQLTNYPFPTRDSHVNSYDPNWSSDGQRIAYMRIGGNGPQFFYSLQVIRPDGTEHRTAYLDTANGEGTWSPDGRSMVVEGYTTLELIDVSSTDFTTLPPRAPIPGSTSADLSPDWQPLAAEPQPGDYKNAAKYCKALQEFLGAAEFAARYGSHGGCVSQRGRAP